MRSARIVAAVGPFDRFNDRAKRVLALAQDEAIRFNHNYIGPEHLILGLVREGEGVAARALDSLGVKLSQLRSAIEFLVGRGDASSSPSQITLHPRTKKIIELAIDEARRLGHSHVGTEHLLLGIVREGDSMAVRALESLGASLEHVRHQVIATLGQQHAPPAGEAVTPRQYGRTEPSADRVLAFALDLAKTLGHEHLGTEHVLLALISVDSPASRVLASLGVTYDKALASVTTLVPRRDVTPTEIAFAPRVNALIGYARGYADGSRGAFGASTLLLGLVADPEGVGMQVLVMLGVTAEKVRAAFGGATGWTEAGWHSTRTYRPPQKLSDAPLDDLDESAKAVLASAAEEAKRLRHNYIGTEHLLAAIVASDASGAAAKALARLGVELSKVRTALEFIVGPGDAAPNPDELTLSPRSMKVLELARGQARALQHAKVTAADLLLGLVEEGQGIAAGIMESLGVTLDRVRQAVFGELGSAAPAGESTRRGSPGPFGHFSDRAKRVLALAQNEAIRLNHNYIGTEHLLLGLMCESSNIAAAALTAAGLELDAARAEVERIVGRGASIATPTDMTLSPRTKKVLDIANDEAKRLGAAQTRPGHLLLGMLREGEGIGCQIIEAGHISLESLRADVLRRLSDPGANPSA